jgi:hypothetical protein
MRGTVGKGKWQEESSFFEKKEAKKLLSVGVGLWLRIWFLRLGDFLASPTSAPSIRLEGEANE